jgi:hypothetical protein
MDTADNGGITYVQLTFSSTTTGTYFATAYDNQGDPPTFSNGTFTLP